MLEVISTPTRQKGLKTSRWVACHNPVVFKIQTDALPNSRDAEVTFTSVSEFRGFAVFALSSAPSPEWFAPFLKVSLSGAVYNGIATASRFDPSTLELYTNLSFISDDSGTANKYYDGYVLEVLPTIGLPDSHVWSGLKPRGEGTIQRIEPLNSVAVFDLQKQLQRNVNNQNNLQQISFPNDLNAFTGFTFAYRESYIDLEGVSGDAEAISGYGDSTGFVILTVSDISGFSPGGYAELQGFQDDSYNGAIVRIVQIVNSTTLEIEMSYDAYLVLTGYETIQPYSVTLSRFNSDYIEEGERYWAVNAKQALGSFFGSNLIDYVASSSVELSRFMTVFERRQVFADKYEDFTVIVDTPLLDGIVGDVVMAYKQEELDINGSVISTNIEVIDSQGEGVYRFPTGGNPTDAVINLTSGLGLLGVELNWDSLEDIPLFSNYEIWRSESPDVLVNGSLLDISVTNSYVDQNALLNSGITYYYRVRALGAFASKFSNEVSASYLVIVISTDWDTGTDGNFVGDLVFSDATIADWGLPDGTIVNTNNLDTALGGFDGTVKDVRILVSDFSKIEAIDITAKIVGELDISLATQLEVLDVRDNLGMTKLTTASSVIGAGADLIRASDCSITGVQDFSNTLFVSEAFVDISDNPITGVNFSTSLGVNDIGRLILSACDIQGNLDLSNTIVQRIDATSLNPNWTSFSLYSGAVVAGSSILILGANITGVVDLSNLTVSSVVIQNQNITEFVLSSTTSAMDAISVNGNPIRLFDFGGATFSGSVFIQLQNLNDNGLMTSAEISQMCIDIDARASAGSGLIRFDGDNPSLDASGIIAKDSLILKGYSVLFN